MIRVAVLTVSDRCSRGECEDLSGPAIEEALPSSTFAVHHRRVVPDDPDAIAGTIIEWADGGDVDLVLTTGGTGLGPRDVTPEATMSVCDRLVPGFAEAMRIEGLKHTPNAVLSRAAAGIRKRTLIVNLPGSPRAVRECLDAILDALPHAVAMMQGQGH
jgi:molybdopterin adenylyltransferase